jgi:hypothetical protein
MSERHKAMRKATARRWIQAADGHFAGLGPAWLARQPAAGPAKAAGPQAATGPQATPAANPRRPGPSQATHITPEQAKQLFSLVDELIKFSSDETGLPIKSTSSARSPAAPRWKAT